MRPTDGSPNRGIDSNSGVIESAAILRLPLSWNSVCTVDLDESGSKALAPQCSRQGVGDDRRHGGYSEVFGGSSGLACTSTRDGDQGQGCPADSDIPAATLSSTAPRCTKSQSRGSSCTADGGGPDDDLERHVRRLSRAGETGHLC
jgi:hypothetical protein